MTLAAAGPIGEVLDVHYQAMHHALYRRILMAIKIASNLPAFLLLPNSFLATTVAINHVMIHKNYN
jgi:hypothetical protein